MQTPVLSVPAQVRLQGEHLIRLVVFSPNRAEFQLLGFSQPVVKLVDTRPASLERMQRHLRTGSKEPFLPSFNRPSLVDLWAEYPRQIRIELHETSLASPSYVFWISQDSPQAIPLYPYLFRHATRLEGANQIHFAVYRLLQPEKQGLPALSRAA